jgi:hypothetical protein
MPVAGVASRRRHPRQSALGLAERHNALFYLESQPAHSGLDRLCDKNGPFVSSGQDGTESLEPFLMAVPEGTPILITGHSLGGCLASVLAPCVADWRGSASSLADYTIAAPSPGNVDFAAYYNTLFTDPSGHSTAFRFFNSLDVVPNAWATLATVMTYYPPLIPCPSDIDKIVIRAETAVGGEYCQLGQVSAGSAVELTGTIVTPLGALQSRPELSPFENARFLLEAARQHACTTYQTLLQTPLTLPAVGKLKHALAVGSRDAQPQ